MRLTTWNCPRNNIDTCLSLTAHLDADLVVLQECRRPSGSNPAVIWRGDTARSGTAVISRHPELKLEPLDIRRPDATLVPAAVHGPVPFLFVGVCTHKRYIESARDSMTACVAAASGLPVVAAGDFNISPAVSGKRQKALRFLEWMRNEFGLVSAYHELSGETPGEETCPTHYHQWNESKPFHIDYCFLPESWTSRIAGVEVGTYDEWRMSDHRPLTVSLRDSSA